MTASDCSRFLTAATCGIGARAVGAFLLALAVSTGAGPAAAQQRDVLSFGRIATSGTPLAVEVGLRRGFFDRQGIDLRLVDLGGVHHQVAAVDRGDVDIAHTATPYLVQAVLAGSSAVGVVGAPANVIYSLMARPEVKSYADLKGKVVGVSLLQDTISITTRKMLAAAGLTEGRDYTTVLKIGPARVACLRAGECAAVATNAPTDIVLKDEGFTALGDSVPVIPDLQFNLLAARRDWASSNRGLIVRFARAMGDSYRYMRDPANRDEVAALVAETSAVTPGVARRMLAGYYTPDRGSMPRQAEINLKGVQAVLDLLTESGELKTRPDPASFLDLSYLREAGLM